MIAANYTLYPSHHRSGTTLETSHMTYRPRRYIFPFLVFSPYPTHSYAVRPIADRCTVQSGPYHTLRRTRTLCSFYLSFVFKTFVSTPKKKEVLPPELRLKFVSSHCFTSPHLRTFVPSLYFVLLPPFTLSHRSEPLSCTILHSLILHRETISLLQNRTPQNHIGFTLRSPYLQ